MGCPRMWGALGAAGPSRRPQVSEHASEARGLSIKLHTASRIHAGLGEWKLESEDWEFGIGREHEHGVQQPRGSGKDLCRWLCRGVVSD